MEKVTQSHEVYDDLFTSGGYEGAYALPYRHSCYYPLFKWVVRELRRLRVRSVLEVGCGTGAFAHMLTEQTTIAYRGFDFSPVAVQAAARLVGEGRVFVGDATDPESYEDERFDAIVCTEVLEHLVSDRAAIAPWPRGVRVVCSVPNFDSRYHERFFRAESEVRNRYGDGIAIETVARIRKPALTDISLRNRLRELRWARTEPRRMAALLGLQSFDRGGWFAFSGLRR